MSVILIATQVTGEHSKGYIEGIPGGSPCSGNFGNKGWWSYEVVGDRSRDHDCSRPPPRTRTGAH
jgi:hypothetical protein